MPGAVLLDLALLRQHCASGQAGPAPRSRRQQTRSQEEAQQLFRELTELATAAGPRGAFRGVQAAQAALSIGVEYAQGLFTGVQVSKRMCAGGSPHLTVAIN